MFTTLRLLGAVLVMTGAACAGSNVVAATPTAPTTISEPKPGQSGIAALSHIIGTWDCREVFHAGGWTPKEIVSENARDVFSWGPGKKFILADYESLSELGLFEAHDVIFWDEAKQTYKFFFFDSFSGGVQEQDGVLTRDRLVFSHRMEMNGNPGTFVRDYRFESPTTQSLEVEFRPDVGDVIRIATISKTKRP